MILTKRGDDGGIEERGYLFQNKFVQLFSAVRNARRHRTPGMYGLLFAKLRTWIVSINGHTVRCDSLDPDAFVRIHSNSIPFFPIFTGVEGQGVFV